MFEDEEDDDLYGAQLAQVPAMDVGTDEEDDLYGAVAPSPQAVPIPQQPVARPQQQKVPTWPEYLAANPADPIESYNTYIDKVMRPTLRSQGYTNKEIVALQQRFMQAVPPPTRKEESKSEKGVIGNIGATLKQTAEELALDAEAVKARANNDLLALRDVQQKKKKLQEETIPSRAAWSEAWEKVGGPIEWAQAVADNPEGAAYGAVALAAGFVPFIVGARTGAMVGGLAGPLGAGLGAATGMAAVGGSMREASESLRQLEKAAQADGVNLDNLEEVKKWATPKNVAKVFGIADTAALSEAAMLFLTFGIAGKFGSIAAESTAKIVPKLEAGVALPTAAETATLAARARKYGLAQQATELGGFTLASPFGDIVIGETPSIKGMVENAALQILTAGRGAYKQYKRPAQAEAVARNRLVERDRLAEEATAEAQRDAELEAELTRLLEAETLPEVDEQLITHDKVPSDKLNTLMSRVRERLQEREDARAQRMRDGTYWDVAPEDVTATVKLVAELKQDEHNEQVLEKAKAALDAEVEAKSPVEGVPPVEEQPTSGADRPSEISGLQQGSRGEVAEQPRAGAGVGVGEESLGQGGEGLPRSGEPTGGVGGIGAGAAARPIVPGRDTAGTAGVGTGVSEVTKNPLQKPYAEKVMESIAWMMKNLPADAKTASEMYKDAPEYWQRVVKRSKNASSEVNPHSLMPTSELATKYLNREYELERELYQAIKYKDKDAEVKVQEELRLLKEEAKKELAFTANLEGEKFTDAIEALIKAQKLKGKETQFYRLLANGNTEGALKYLSTGAKNIRHRILAKQLLKLNILPSTKFLNHESINTLGTYKQSSDTVFLDSGYYLQRISENNRGKLEQTFLHEVVHAGTVNAMSKAYEIYRNIGGLKLDRKLLENFTPEQKVKYIEVLKSALTAEERAYIETAEYKATVKLIETFEWLQANKAKTTRIQYEEAVPSFRVAGISLDREGFANPIYKIRKWGTQENVDPNTLPVELKKLWDNLERRHAWEIEYAKNNNFDRSRHYGATDPLEMVAEAFTNKEFQDYLKSITLPKELTGSKPANAWEWFTNIVRKLLGLEGLKDNALAEIMADVSHVTRARQKGGRELITEAEVTGLSRFYDDYPQGGNVSGGPAAMASPPAPPASPSRSTLHGWKGGAWQFGATPVKVGGQPTGKWRIITSVNLHDPNQPRQTTIVNDYAQVQQQYATGSFAPSKRADEARAQQATQAGKPEAKFVAPSEFVQTFADREAGLKGFGEQGRRIMADLGKPLLEVMDPYLANVRKNSLTENALEALLHDRLKPMERKGRALLDKYRRNAKQFDADWTQLMDEDGLPEMLRTGAYQANPQLQGQLLAKIALAKAHVAALPQPYRDALLDFAKDVKQLHNDMYDYMADNGLMSKTEAAEFKARHKLYVPLREDEKSSTGYRATGLERPPVDPLLRVVTDWNNVIRRNYENKETVAAVNLARELNWKQEDGKPMFEFAPVPEYKFDKFGELALQADPLSMRKDSVVYWVDGEPHRVAILEPSIRRALERVPIGDRQQALNTTLHGMAMFNAIYGGLKTALSPVFAMKNFIRDVGTGLVQADSTVDRGQFLKALASGDVWRMAAKEAAAPIFKKRALSEAKEQGALISRRGTAGLIAERRDPSINLDPSMGRHAEELRRNIFGFEEGSFTGALSLATRTTENVVRMALYSAAMKSPKLHAKVGKANGTTGAAVDAALHKSVPGRTPEERALISHLQAEAGVAAKTATVNFEPKGRISGFLNALFVFSNAKTQGARTYAEQLGLSRKYGGTTFAERLKRGNRITQGSSAAALAGGVLSAMIGYNLDPENYGRMEDYQKDDNLVLKSGSPSVPYPQEMSIFHTLGQALVDAFRNPRWPDPALRMSKAGSRFVTRLIQSFWPGGTSMSDPTGSAQGKTSQYVSRLVTPTAVQPIADIAMQSTTFGSPIVTGLDRKRRPPPGVAPYQHKADLVSPLARGIAEGLHTTGVAETYPQNVQHIVNQMVKQQVDFTHAIAPTFGFFNNIFGEPKKASTGEEKRNVFERTFFQEASPFTYKNDLEELAEFETIKNVDQGLKKSPKLNILQQGEKEESKLYKGYNKLTDAQKEKVNKKAEDLRRNTLKKYAEQYK